MKKRYSILMMFAVCILCLFSAGRAQASEIGGGIFGGTDDEPYDETDDGYNDDLSTDEMSECTFTVSQNVYRYTGRPIEPAVTVTGKDAQGNPVTLVNGTDYTVSYENNTDCGVGRIIIRGYGTYSGYHIEKFGILPKKMTKVTVKSPHYMEATLTWKKVAGADGFYVYRKGPGEKDYKFIANITDGNYQVFHDQSKKLKNNKKYKYKVVPYVKDEFYDEATDGDVYQKPTPNDTYDPWDYWFGSSEYENTTSYYEALSTPLYSWYDYSCIKGKCLHAYTLEDKVYKVYKTASGKVTKTISKARYPIYTGDAYTDYAANYILTKNIKIKNSMSDEKRVKAIYDWMATHCTFTKDVKDYTKLKKMKRYYNANSKKNKKAAEKYEEKLMKQIYTGKALCVGMGWWPADRALDAMCYRAGSCSYLTPMFNILCEASGVEAYTQDGEYINSDKSRAYHNFSFVRLGKTYYWYDTAIACRHPNSRSVWYKKGTKFWKTCHA